MQSKYLSIFFVFFAYTIALAHDVIPHHHHPANTISIDHVHHEAIPEIQLSDDDHDHNHNHLCHYASNDGISHGDSAKVSLGGKLYFPAIVPTVYTSFLSPLQNLRKQNFQLRKFYFTSENFCSFGLRGPPC